eukprot:TRINITY_DN74783_c0_g1_i1.p1 TRINITY_DN74783_c0_g1~~TRINITY_DN74783_c0_g1_i1.p1  ORF type:complete len:214 (-),score=21.02 TRINITY_DN74783_c0_g1_i1:287-928(-)
MPNVSCTSFSAGGHDYQIRELRSGCIGVHLYDSAPRLLEELKGLRDSWQDVEVLELGTGCGAIAIGLAKLGAKVYATDFDRGALKNLRFNIHSNGVASRVKVVRWDWHEGLPLDDVPLSNVSYCVGSDLVYGSYMVPGLSKAVLDLRKLNPNLTFRFCLQEREGLPVRELVDACRTSGLPLETHPEMHSLGDGVKSGLFGVYIFPDENVGTAH